MWAKYTGETDDPNIASSSVQVEFCKVLLFAAVKFSAVACGSVLGKIRFPYYSLPFPFIS